LTASQNFAVMVALVSADAFLGLGLKLAGYKHWRRYKEKPNLERFRSHFGVLPKTCEDMWSDMLTSTDPECRLESNADPKHLLLGIHFLWKYKTEQQLFTMFQLTEKTVRKWCSLYVQKMQLLLPNKVCGAMIVFINHDD